MKPIIETERLILRDWKDQDTEWMAKINGDPEVMGFFPSTQTLDDTKKFIRMINDHKERFNYFLYALERKDTGEFIGFTGLNHVLFEIPALKSEKRPVVEIGWRLDKNQWNQGFASEAARAVLDHAFRVLDLEEIFSLTAKINKRSLRVMQKIGLKHDSKDDFDHPKLNKESPLLRHVLYRLKKSDYL